MFVPRALLLRVLLALLLVFAQQQAVRHGLAHDLGRIHAPSQDATGTEEAFCAKCLAIAHLDHTDAVAAVVVVVAAVPPHAVAPASRESVELAFASLYQSRAPPVLS